MPFTKANIEQFREEGYTTVEDFWTEREVAAMRAELDRLVRDGLLRNVTTDGDGKTHSNSLKNLQICPIVPKSEFFRAVPFAPIVLDTVPQLIGSPMIEHLDQIFLKPARTGTGTNWHQDNAYFRIADPLRGTAMWSALHDATRANGTLRVIPGSHKEVYEHSRDPYSDHHIRCYPPEERAVDLELPAGGVAFFCYGTAHATGKNQTDRDRAGLAIHFLHADYAKKELIEDSRTTRPYLNGPNASGGLQEYGVRVEGSWEGQVDRMLAAAAVN